jgi:hypothetical protein
MESACFFKEYGVVVPEYVVECWQNLVIHYNTILLNFAAVVIPKLPSVYVQGDQKVSVHLTITVYYQVHRDFLSPCIICTAIYALVTDFLNPLNAELNLIYHLLVLLGDLTFMVPCIVSTRYSNIRVYPTRCNVT